MTQQVVEQQVVSPTADATPDFSGVDARASALMAKYAAEERTARASEPEDAEESPGATTEPETPAAKKTSEKVVEAGSEATLSKLEQLAQAERESVRRRQESQQQERSYKELESKLAARERDIVAREQAFADPDLLLAMLEEKVGASKLSEWIIAQGDPAKRAVNEAKKSLTPVEERLMKLEKEIADRDRHARITQENAAAEASFTKSVEEVSGDAPLLARAIKNSPSKTIRLAHMKADELRESGKDVTLYAVIQGLEEDLRDLNGPQTAADDSDNSKSKQATKPKASATAKTLTNGGGSSRTAIVEGSKSNPAADLEERIRRAERRLSSG